MNINEFKQLSEGDAQLLIKTPALITVLIAAADGKIEAQETKWAEKVVSYREHVGDDDLFSYYQAVEENFKTTLESILADDVVGSQDRVARVTAELEKISPILKSVNRYYAEKLLASWKSFAKQIAQSSGGFLGYGSVSSQEEHLMDLPMIQL
jgi:hypothetical protein